MSDYGIAIDLGTSMLSISFSDILKKERFSLIQTSNPQTEFGEDIITRIEYEVNRKDTDTSLTDLIQETICKAIEVELTRRNIPLDQVTDVVVVGNTVMHHLLFGLPLTSLLEEPYRTIRKDCVDTYTNAIGLPLENARLYSPPLIDSYVGSDALSVILGYDLLSDETPSITLDIGTNSETMVQHDGVVWVGSAASGPAFERMALKCGMSAIDGAIKRIHVNLGENALTVDTIGNVSPRGICGVGSLSALHAFRRLDLIDRNGSIDRNSSSDVIKSEGDIYWIEIVDSSYSSTKTPIYLDQMDIRMLQQSKASIRAVIGVLLREAGCNASEIQTLNITGAFGASLDVESAQAIDILPQLSQSSSVTQRASGALAGTELLLWNRDLRSNIDGILQKINYVEMMGNPLYQELHAEHLFFP